TSLPLLFQGTAQFLQTSDACRADTPLWGAERRGDLRIGRRLVAVEEERQEGAAALIQGFDRQAHAVLLLHLQEQFVRQRRLVRQGLGQRLPVAIAVPHLARPFLSA